MSAPSIPTNYTIASNVAVSGSLDMDLDEIRIKELPKITVDMGLDDIRIRELPKINLYVELAMKPTRIHFPVNLKLGLNALGDGAALHELLWREHGGNRGLLSPQNRDLQVAIGGDHGYPSSPVL